MFILKGSTHLFVCLFVCLFACPKVSNAENQAPAGLGPSHGEVVDATLFGTGLGVKQKPNEQKKVRQKTLKLRCIYM